MKVGYARVSSTDQDLTVQLKELKKQGCKRIFQEKKSGWNAEDRVELQRMLDFVRTEDVVVCTKTDRIARNTIDALKIANELQEKRVGFILLDLGDVDINSDVGRVIYTIMSTFAELERKRMKQRQAEGIAKAKAEGKHLGRKSMLTDEFIRDIRRTMKRTGSAGDTAKLLSISKNTVYKAMRISGK